MFMFICLYIVYVYTCPEMSLKTYLKNVRDFKEFLERE